VFSESKDFNCLLIPCIGDQVESPQPFYCNNLTVTDCLGGRKKGIPAIRTHVTGSIPEFQPGSAHRTGIGLSMKPPIQRISIFLQTFGTHFERFHGSIRTVVRQGFCNCESRTTVSAVGKRILIASVVRIRYFRKALRTSSNIGKNKRAPNALLFTVPDHKIRKTDRVQI